MKEGSLVGNPTWPLGAARQRLLLIRGIGVLTCSGQHGRRLRVHHGCVRSSAQLRRILVAWSVTALSNELAQRCFTRR